MKKLKFILVLVISLFLFSNVSADEKCTRLIKGNDELVVPNNKVSGLICLYMIKNNSDYEANNGNITLGDGENDQRSYYYVLRLRGDATTQLFGCNDMNCGIIANLDNNFKAIDVEDGRDGLNEMYKQRNICFGNYCIIQDSGESTDTLYYRNPKDGGSRTSIDRRSLDATVYKDAFNNGCPSNVGVVYYPGNSSKTSIYIANSYASLEDDAHYLFGELIDSPSNIYTRFVSDYTFGLDINEFSYESYGAPFIGYHIEEANRYTSKQKGLGLIYSNITEENSGYEEDLTAFIPSSVGNTFDEDSDINYLAYNSYYKSNIVDGYCSGSIVDGSTVSGPTPPTTGTGKVIEHTCTYYYGYQINKNCCDPQAMDIYYKFELDANGNIDVDKSFAKAYGLSTYNETAPTEIIRYYAWNMKPDEVSDYFTIKNGDIENGFECGNELYLHKAHGTDDDYVGIIPKHGVVDVVNPPSDMTLMKLELNSETACLINGQFLETCYKKPEEEETPVGEIGTIKYKCMVDHTKDLACGSVYFIPPQLPYFTSLIMTLIKILVPLALIIKGSIDLIKAITGRNADEIRKQRIKFFTRLIPAVIIFLIVAIVQFTVGIVATDSENSTIAECIDCFINGEDHCNKTSEGRIQKYCEDLSTYSPVNPFNPISSNPGETGVVNNICTSSVIYKGKGYNLTQDQKKKIAAMILGEYGSDIDGMKAVASQMANLYEYRQYKKSSCGNKSFYDYITSPTGDKCHWYATANAQPTNNATALQVVEDVIVNGNRTLPAYIDEFDMYPGEVEPQLSVTEYVTGITQISGKYGGSGKFWCISDSGRSGNLYYYSDDTYKKYIEDQYVYSTDGNNNFSWSDSAISKLNRNKNSIPESEACRIARTCNENADDGFVKVIDGVVYFQYNLDYNGTNATKGTGNKNVSKTFSDRLDRFFEEAKKQGYTLWIKYQGWRSLEDQKYFECCDTGKWKEEKPKYGNNVCTGANTCNNGTKAAPAGTSPHGWGIAADIGMCNGSNNTSCYKDKEAVIWAHRNAERFGLTFPVSDEDWHIEPLYSCDVNNSSPKYKSCSRVTMYYCRNDSETPKGVPTHSCDCGSCS